jgi:hypothetical protein
MKNLELETTDLDLGTNPETTEKKEITNRQAQFNRLLKASQAARKIQQRLIDEAPSQAAAIYYKTRPLNFFLLNFVFKTEGITDFKKFNEWKQQGATVKKGEKAFPIWGQPIGKQKDEEAKSKGENYQATEEEHERYPICYVFSNLQVRSIERKEAAC